ESVVLVLAALIAWRSPRHRPFVAVFAIGCLYSFGNHLVLQPWLATRPRPFHGLDRVCMHVGQALYLLVGAAAAIACAVAVRAPRKWALLPLTWWAAVTLALV